MSKKKKKSKKKKIQKHLTRFIIAIIAISIAAFFIFRTSEESPVAFGIRIPAPYKICGIDVSRYQGKINWSSVSQACYDDGKDKFTINFAFIKATEGKSLSDPCFDYNWTNTKKNKILRGAYHYYKPNVNSVLQAQNFIANVQLEEGDLPPVLDIEETGRLGNNNMRAGIKNWLSLIEKHYGIKPIIYCYVDFYERYLKTDDFKDYPFWIAHYYKSELRISDKWYFWQHSDKGKVKGIRTKVDFNVFDGTIDGLREMCK